MATKKKNPHAVALGKLSWPHRTPEQREAHRLACIEGRKKIPATKRAEIARHAAKSVTPAVAHARQIKAWATRRANLAAKGGA